MNEVWPSLCAATIRITINAYLSLMIEAIEKRSLLMMLSRRFVWGQARCLKYALAAGKDWRDLRDDVEPAPAKIARQASISFYCNQEAIARESRPLADNTF